MLDISDDDDVQPQWIAMESRVTKRPRAMTLEEAKAKGVKTGRSNIKKTEEDVWLSEGVYAEYEKTEDAK